MKVLFVGDIHNHLYMIDDIKRLDKEYNFDRVICMGDYVDDWGTDNHNSLETLDKIFKLKKSNKEKYTLLIGNHELSYLGFPCSGHRAELEDVMMQKLKENIDLLNLYTEVELGDRTFVCTHSGLTNDYVCQQLDVYGEWKPILEQFDKDKLLNLRYLCYCSYYRGGRDMCSSFVWADRREMQDLTLREKLIIPYQIIGHSPVQSVCNIVGENFELFFTDTHSTYRDGSPFGDKSYLMWDGEFKVLY